MIAGINKFVIGERDYSGILLKIEEKTLGDIEGLLEWRVDACLNFGDRFLAWIKNHLPVSIFWKGIVNPSLNNFCHWRRPGIVTS